MFTINTSPWGWELEEGIPDELCRILDGICVFVCVCVFSIPSKNTEKEPLTVGSLFSTRSHVLAVVQEVKSA